MLQYLGLFRTDQLKTALKKHYCLVNPNVTHSYKGYSKSVLILEVLRIAVENEMDMSNFKELLK